MENKSFFRTIKCGSIFVGDICYALDRDIYDNVWGAMHYVDGVIEKDGDVCAMVVGTAHGDGTFEATNGDKYEVDAGVIGVTNMNYLCDADEFCFEYGKIIGVPSGIADVLLEFIDGLVHVEITDNANGCTLYHVSIDTDPRYW